MATYKIDPAHSEIHFKVKHLMITNVTGSFEKFDGSFESEAADLTDAKITFEADIDSISTNNPQRDGHLKSDDFFSAEKFPKLTFTSTSFVKNSDEDYTLNGNLDMHGVTNPVTLAVTYNGTTVDPWGNTKLGFEIDGKISRKEWGLSWGVVTEAGSVLLSDDVKLVFNVQFTKA